MARGLTKLAIQAYKKVVVLERRLELAKIKNLMWISKVPEEDMDEYVSTTEHIQKEEDKKLQTELRRLDRRRR